MVFILISKKEQTKYFSSFWVEGIPIYGYFKKYCFKMKIFLFIITLILQPPTVEVIQKSKYHSLVEQGYTIIDVRTHEEYMQGHIPGAQNIDVKAETFITEIQKLSKNQMLFWFIADRVEGSLYAAQVMVSFGFKKIYDLDGGFLNW